METKKTDDELVRLVSGYILTELYHKIVDGRASGYNAEISLDSMPLQVQNQFIAGMDNGLRPKLETMLSLEGYKIGYSPARPRNIELYFTQQVE